MPVIKRTMYLDSCVDACIREVHAALVKRNARGASYTIAVNLILAANIIDVTNGRGFSPRAKERISKHLQNPAKSPIDDQVVRQFSKQVQAILESLTPT
jgi:hypothetical protein